MKLVYCLALVFIFIKPLFAQDEKKQVNIKQENEEEEIWSLEEDYISYFEDANHKAILSFYHSKFLGWPDSELHPADKKRAKKYLGEKYSEPNQVVSQISREGIRILGDIAITHYLLTLSWINDEGIEQSRESRLTRTWIKEDSQWKIFGGMSNRIEIENQ